ncbi:MAG: HAD family hydrolase [Oculatellaceae cyanobacterium bins.114]|nr:HAD family hydrolase [Oculatellaceae cyanobacterium bins.114]
MNQSQAYPHHTCFTLRSTPHLTVFCDFDGPIIDVSDRYYNTYQLALADVQTICETQGTASPFCCLSKTHFWQMKQDRVPDLEIALRSGLRQEQMDYFLQRVSSIVNQPALLHQDQLQPGVRWALELLHSQGARLVLVTLRNQEQATQILQNYGLANLFTLIRGTHDDTVAYGNAAEAKIQLLAEVLREFPYWATEPAWMIGDTEADILAGQASNIPTIALTCGIRSQTYLEKFLPTRIHCDLLSAAHYLISQPLFASV